MRISNPLFERFHQEIHYQNHFCAFKATQYECTKTNVKSSVVLCQSARKRVVSVISLFRLALHSTCMEVRKLSFWISQSNCLRSKHSHNNRITCAYTHIWGTALRIRFEERFKVAFSEEMTQYTVRSALKYIFVDHFWFGVMCRGKWWENSMNHQESPLASIVSYNAYTTLPPPLEMKSHFVLMGLKKGGKCVRWRSCEIVQNEMWTLLRLFVVVALFCRLNDRCTNFYCVHPLSSAFIFPTNKTHYCLYINFVNILKANTLHSLARTKSTLSK